MDGKPASKRLQKLVSEGLGTGPLSISYSVVLFREAAGTMQVAKALGLFDVGGLPVTMIRLYKFIRQYTDSSSFWKPSTDGAECIATGCIVDTLVHSVIPVESAMVIIPTCHTLYNILSLTRRKSHAINVQTYIDIEIASQSTRQPTSQPASQPANQPASEAASLPASQPVKQPPGIPNLASQA